MPTTNARRADTQLGARVRAQLTSGSGDWRSAHAGHVWTALFLRLPRAFGIMKWRVCDFAFLTLACSVLGLISAQDAFDRHFDDSCKEVIECNDPRSMLDSDRRELSSVTSKEDMDRLCPDIMKHLECIDRKTKLCMSHEVQMTFNILYNGTIVVMTELCHNDTYQQEFMRHASCFNNLKDEEDCETTYTHALTDIEKTPGAEHKICCSFQEYVECSKRTVRDNCGVQASEFNKRMIDTMSATLKEQCQQFPLASTECRATSLASRSSATGLVAGASPLALPLLAACAALALASPLLRRRL